MRASFGSGSPPMNAFFLQSTRTRISGGMAAAALTVGLQWLALYGGTHLVQLTIFPLPVFTLCFVCLALWPPGCRGKWRFALLGVLCTAMLANSYIVLRMYAECFIQ